MNEKDLSPPPHSNAPAELLPWAVGLAVIAAIALLAWVIFPNLTDWKKGTTPHTTGVGIATWPGFAPVFLARDRKYFEGVDVKVDVLDDFTARQAAFVNGQHDFTIYTIDSLAFDAGKGVRGAIVLVLDRSNGADGIVARRGISSAAELKGKKVAYTRGSPAHFLLVNVLRGVGLSIKDIQTLEVDDPTRAAEAFLAGSVDAAVTWEPYLGQIKSSGKGVVLVDTKSLDRIVDVLVASPTAIRERPRDVQAVVSGWMRALDELGRARQDSYSIMAKGLGMPEPEFRANAAGVLFASRQMNREWLNAPAGQARRADGLFREAAAIWREEKLSDAPQSSTSFIDNRFVIEELKRTGANGGS